ncbi:hypothetical protein BJX65DRAFT_260449 [Aspergillus insuetus]
MDHGDICILGIREDLLDPLDMEDQGQKGRLMGTVDQELDHRGQDLVGQVSGVLVIMVLDLKDPMVQVCRGLDMGHMGIMDTMAQVVDRVDQADRAGMEDGSPTLRISRPSLSSWVECRSNSVILRRTPSLPKFCPNHLSGFKVMGKPLSAFRQELSYIYFDLFFLFVVILSAASCIIINIMYSDYSVPGKL